MKTNNDREWDEYIKWVVSEMEQVIVRIKTEELKLPSKTENEKK